MKVFVFRRQLKKHKKFLKSFYLNTGVYKHLKKSTLPELNIIIQILHYIVKGKIPLKKSLFQSEARQQKLNDLHENFASEAQVQQLLQTSKKKKIETLSKHVTLFSRLLYKLFNE